MKLIPLLLVLAFAGPALAEPPCWVVQPAKSQLAFIGDQAGASARGEFKKFDVQFCFDPAHTAGRLRVTVDTNSLDTRNSRRDEVLRSQNFFDVAKYPQAVYAASTFARAGTNEYTANGTLTLRGQTHPVPVTFTFTTSGSDATVQGKSVIHRLDFGVGQGEWGDPRWVGKDVTLEFDLHLRGAAGGK